MNKKNTIFLIASIAALFFINSYRPFEQRHIIDANNSTTVRLAANDTFIGKWVDVSKYSMAWISIIGANASATGTLIFDVAHDTDSLATFIPRPITDITFDKPHPLTLVERYFRVRYANGATAQAGTFLLQTKFANAVPPLLSHKLDDPIKDELDGITLSRNISSTNDERNFGRFMDQSVGRKFGRNDAVGATEETVWANGGLYPNITTLEFFRIAAGGNSNDASAGSGARSVIILYLDSLWNEVLDTIATNGTSASANSKTKGRRFIRAWVYESGAYNTSNTGSIAFENTTSGQTVAFIPAAEGQTQLGLTTVPSGKVLYITNIIVTVGQGNSADVVLYQTRNADDTTTPFTSTRRVVWAVQDYSGAQNFPLQTYLEFPEKTDLRFEAVKITGGGNARVSIDFGYILRDN